MTNKSDNILVTRLTLGEINSRCTMEEHSKKLFVKNDTGNIEIGVVYFRAGYTPDDYKTQNDWEARLLLERSYAIKCPNISTHIAGSKKVQQVLADPEQLKRFVWSDIIFNAISKTFADMYPMDDSPHGLKGREIALHKPNHYVLKPQREGGGNNIYREEIPKFLKSIPESHWPSYILMELIEPPERSGTILRDGQTKSGATMSELGVFGCHIWNTENGDVVESSVPGYLVRTKFRESNEGGVATGWACLDSLHFS